MNMYAKICILWKNLSVFLSIMHLFLSCVCVNLFYMFMILYEC